MPLLVGRAVTALAAAGAALAVIAPPALAAVTATTDGIDHVFVVSDELLDDPVSMTCSSGDANVNGSSAIPELACSDVTTVVVDAGEGAQAVNLGGVTELAFPALVRTTIDVDDTDADSVTGSEGRDVVDADAFDTVTGGLGDDWVEGAGTASGGGGDDVLRNISDDIQGGSGDDRIVNPGGGSINGGDGRDVLVQDYTASPVQQTVTLYISNAMLGPAPGVGSSSTGIEEYDLTTSTGVRADTIDSTAYSGVVVVDTLDGDDTVRGGPAADVVNAGPGNDTVNPGGGSDLVRGGDGDDMISVRDGVADSVDCGSGNDTVIADRSDSLTGCENVSLPPPETSAIVGETKVRKNDKVLFAFAASVASATFECAVDTGPYKPCTSPFTVKSRKLAVGTHTLSVRAVQPAGNPDPTPSTLAFKVKHKKKK
jgi:Ca2+-binding RTX toxin-like protein